MHYKILLLAVFVAVVNVNAFPSLVLKDEEGQQYRLTQVLSRQRRQGPQLFGGGAANKNVQHGLIGLRNPNGSGGSIGYAHGKGYGHDLSVDAMVPVWSKKNRFGESTVNVGGGVSHHMGGFSGNHLTDKRVGINFVRRF